jgi:hypothetical protein
LTATCVGERDVGGCFGDGSFGNGRRRAGAGRRTENPARLASNPLCRIAPPPPPENGLARFQVFRRQRPPVLVLLRPRLHLPPCHRFVFCLSRGLSSTRSIADPFASSYSHRRPSTDPPPAGGELTSKNPSFPSRSLSFQPNLTSTQPFIDSAPCPLSTGQGGD